MDVEEKKPKIFLEKDNMCPPAMVKFAYSRWQNVCLRE